ncbi:MAG: hypothetical protein ACXADX_15225 [Candidatus Hodarchaeales archaeon]|jgi:hypothetical protein
MELDPLFADVMPYLANFAEVKKLLLELQSQTKDLNELYAALEDRISSQEYSDPTFRTDLRIILQFLDKKKQKSSD